MASNKVLAVLILITLILSVVGTTLIYTLTAGPTIGEPNSGKGLIKLNVLEKGIPPTGALVKLNVLEKGGP